ncbi:hypothetical protein [Alicyclobacillus sp. SO9]|uniref:hypothetical protein n=1 Tax=Alicyclobacillus sp. SO9 TaxID=2665646 RepID=UPI0018E86025|nr:hypothetical protein [Alicyclobacillus sp. SO9]QQE77196.1 hypothetical protein GI364_14610 [Alicyclobacillus sp. SO9]
MSKQISLLGTHSASDNAEVEQCILPLIVLFSIAAQENRAGAAAGRARVPRPGTPYGRGPQRAVTGLPPLGGPGSAAGGYTRPPGIGARRPVVPGGHRPGLPVHRGFY